MREDSDLTQEQLCRRLYMHKTTYTNYEQGKHTVPLLEQLLEQDEREAQ